MERRNFVKYTSLAGIAAGLFPVQSIAALTKSNSPVLVSLPSALTQIRHGALNLPFAAGIKKEMPFDWILDVHQNIFLKNGFQRNLEQDLDVTSIALEIEDGFEALQVAHQNDSLHLVWKEEAIDIKLDQPMQQIELAEDAYTFHVGHLNKEETTSLEDLADRQYFIQVISGSLRFDDLTLTNETGLGLFSLKDGDSFVGVEDACFLVVGK